MAVKLHLISSEMATAMKMAGAFSHGFNVEEKKTREGKRIWGWTDFW